jgi:hypothetical protein
MNGNSKKLLLFVKHKVWIRLLAAPAPQHWKEYHDERQKNGSKV